MKGVPPPVTIQRMAKGPDVLSPEQREAELKRPRPRNLPIAPTAPKALRRLPLAEVVRPQDLQARPIYAVWEITLQCDLACRHCGSRAGHAREGVYGTGGRRASNTVYVRPESFCLWPWSST